MGRRGRGPAGAGALLMAGVLWAGAAPGQELAAPPPPPEPPERPGWSVGAGVGLSVAGGIGLTGTLAVGVTPSVSFERRLGDHLWLGLGLEATYAKTSQALLVTGLPGTELKNIGFGVAAVPRWIVSPPESPVELSLFAAVGFLYSDVVYTQAGQSAFEVRQLGGSLGAGLAAERRLLEWMGVRIGARLVRVQLYQLEVTLPGSAGSPAPQQTSGLDYSLDLVPSPTLELRLYF